MNNVPNTALPPFNVLKQTRYGPMLYNQNDRYTGTSYKKYGEWKEMELNLLRAILRPGMTILDIGANIGQHSVFFAQVAGLQGSVFAFEPQRLFFQTLCANVALNQLVKVYARQVAVGETCGEISVPLMSPWQEQFNYSALSLNDHSDQEHSEMVELITIDSLRLLRCDFMKIEVVGMEQAVIAGASETIQRCRPMLYVENDLIGHDSETLDAQKVIEKNRQRRMDLIRSIDALGYDLFWHVAPYFNQNNHFKCNENCFGPSAAINMLCLPREAGHRVSGIERIDPNHIVLR